ncbi:cytochrome P450 [Actinoplanes palleronii]|uniref:Cytochrome P450 n=1 Tax=Actinoplanes palleronii TaxID=113570 RepID=A0ABQ4BS74_9ACTN|nr:cytochrome P450 [Actinoplanes palleronii]GIE73523.1 cytochrome P450 [Actinoplanes palleronii]
MSETVPVYPFAHPAALEPSPEWERLRDECPVSRVRMVSGDEALLLTRYADVRELLADPRFTHSLTAPDAAKVSTADDGGVFSSENSAMTAGPDHPRWRRMMNKSFTVKRVTAMRPRIEEIAHQLIDDMLAGGQPGDLQSALGFPLPVFVICELLGVDPGYRDKFSHWSDAMLNLTKYDQDELTTAAAEFQAFMVQHVQDKRSKPGDDLLSELAAVVDSQDGRLSEEELVITAQGLLVAGHETTANMIGKMVSMLLADRPRRWERLLDDRGLINSAVEESLRFDANPGFGLPRYISEDIEVAGCPIAAGTTVVVSMASGNRDERAYPEAGEMLIDRVPNPHLAFGVGPHSCLGQALARTELQVVLAVLLDRLPTLELAVPAGELRRRDGLIVGGLEEVPVRW